MNKKRLTLTVGITTCYGEYAMIDTVRSIRNSKGVGDFKFIIIADRVPISPQIKRQLRKYKVELIENKLESGQIRKKKQILDRAKTDIVIFTQDDVIYEPSTISKIMKSFRKDPEVTFISVNNQPVKATAFLEDVISVGTRVGYRISKYWNSGDNFLSIVGRCEAFRADFVRKKFRFIDSVISTDAFFYFENKKHEGKHVYLENAKLYFKNPQKISTHVRKSSRFQHSRYEMLKYFDESELDYSVPLSAYIRSIFVELFTNPIKFWGYIVLYFYTRIIRVPEEKSLTSPWDFDVSTKKVLNGVKQ